MLQYSMTAHLAAGGGVGMAVSVACHQALLALGIYEPILFINTLANEAWRMEESSAYHAHAILMLVSISYI